MSAETTSAKELLDKVSVIKSGTSKEIARERNKATAAGAGVGAIMGFYFATSKGQNMLVCGIIGAAVGAITIRLVMPKS